MNNEPTIWGGIFFVWVLLAIPAYLTRAGEVTHPSPTTQHAEEEKKFTGLALWWSSGLALLVILWALGIKAIGGGLALTAFLAISISVRRLFRAYPELSVSLSHRRIRIICSVLGMWLLLVQSGGFILDWRDHFSLSQFIALHALPPLLSLVAYCCLQWVRNAKAE